MNRRVIVRLKGGLGNQLFCYAAARRLALVNEAELVIDHVTGFARDHRFQRTYALSRFQLPARTATPRERLEPCERYRRWLIKRLARRQPFDRRAYLEQESMAFDPRLLAFKVNGTVWLDGYWQSENYFKDVAAVIRQDLRIDPPGDQFNRDMAKRIQSCSAIGVHIRWFDPPDAIPTGAGHNLPRRYYADAVQRLLETVTEPHFFLFSDDLKAARQVLALPQDMVTGVGHNRDHDNAVADLWLLSQCQHFIIANSTFSWWGAWLADAAIKLVIAPAVKLDGAITCWGFPGLLPDAWIQL